MKVARDPALCHGCRTCEVMCSFHHRKEISPEHSSIQVGRDNATGSVDWSVDATCDGCAGEEYPFCIRYCLYDALRRVTS